MRPPEFRQTRQSLRLTEPLGHQIQSTARGSVPPPQAPGMGQLAHGRETYIRIKGQWYYLYRAVDTQGQTIDFLLTAQRDEQAAMRFLTKAIRRHGVPENITIDGSAANEAAIKSYNEAHGSAIEIRKVKYPNNIVAQDHRGVKRVTRPMLGSNRSTQPKTPWSGSNSCTCSRKNR